MTMHLAQILQMTKQRHNHDYEAYGAILNSILNILNTFQFQYNSTSLNIILKLLFRNTFIFSFQITFSRVKGIDDLISWSLRPLASGYIYQILLKDNMKEGF